jgi:hypothetical protein
MHLVTQASFQQRWFRRQPHTFRSSAARTRSSVDEHNIFDQEVAALLTPAFDACFVFVFLVQGLVLFGDRKGKATQLYIKTQIHMM